MAVGIAGHDIAADARRVFDAVSGGGVAIVHLDVGYAVLGHTADSVRRIYAAKSRSYDKPTGIVGNGALHEALHILGAREREMVRRITVDHDLPLAVIAPYRSDHPLLAALDPFVHANAVKGKTLNILLNAGELRTAIADLAVDAGRLFVGSSANVSLRGIKYRLEGVDAELRAIADIEIDYGQSAYHNAAGLSSTMIDFSDFRVQRAGVCFEAIAAVMQSEFGIALQRPQ
jgi:tRNA A37 threonylcarbamoyladenosine synthetase subunit TsaC/SUA5/YrdC